MHQVIAAPFLGSHFIVRPGHVGGVKLPAADFQRLEAAAADAAQCPDWLTGPVLHGLGVDLHGRALAEAVLVREESTYGYGRASYELNLGCNYDCEHCYLGLKQFSGLAWEERAALLRTIRDSGVLYLQLTGGEPLIDKLFADTYRYAAELGMLLHISTNASKLHDPRILALLDLHRPYRITVSIYGASEAAYDGLVRRRGAWKLFMRGMSAAVESGLPLRLNIVLTTTNAHEEAEMIAMAEQWGIPYLTYANLSPTIYSGAEVLVAQSQAHLKKRQPFGGCNAGHTFYHVDPQGLASICKVGRDQQINLATEGLAGLDRLGAIAEHLMLRTGGCSGCAISGWRPRAGPGEAGR